MISETELAMIERLRAGLGQMVKEVSSYGGELDDVGAIVRALPAVWVTFLGIQSSAPVSTHKNSFRVMGRFAVMVTAYNVRQEAAQRRGGPQLDEVGCNLIVRSVRRLLTRQDMGLPIEPLLPGRVRSLFSSRLNEKAMSAYSCEFDTVWIEEALECGHWPAPEGDDDPDRVFAWYRGRLDKPYPMHESTGLAYHLDGQGPTVAQDIIFTEAKDHD